MAATTETPRSWYTDRAIARSFLGIESTITTKDAQIDRFIARASKRIETYTGRRFMPWTGTKEFDYQGPGKLILGDDLVSSAPTITHNDGNNTVASGDYFLYPLNAVDDNKPYLYLELLLTDDYMTYQDTRQSAITIDGKWGYCEIAKNSTSLLTAQIDAAVTTVGVDAGTDFSIGQVIKIDDEQMFITNISTNDLTVSRALNGTTAAIHINDSIVYILKAPEDIQMACEILVARWFHRADASWADRVGSGETSRTYRPGMPKGVIEILKPFRRMVGSQDGRRT